MGRVKLPLKPLEKLTNRQITYSKRRKGILKKARELSILCDVDIALLLFSPTEKPTLFLGEKSSLDRIVARLARLTPQEREKRRLESLDTLKKAFKKMDHEVNIEELLYPSNQEREDLQKNLRCIQEQISNIHKNLWYYGNELDQINTLEQARDVEATLQGAIMKMKTLKEDIREKQWMQLDGSYQEMLHPGIDVSFLVVDDDQQMQPFTSMGIEDQFGIAPRDASNMLLPQRDIDCIANLNLSMPPRYDMVGKQLTIEESSSGQHANFYDLNKDILRKE